MTFSEIESELRKRPSPTKDQLVGSTKDQCLQKTNFTKDYAYKRPTLSKNCRAGRSIAANGVPSYLYLSK